MNEITYMDEWNIFKMDELFPLQWIDKSFTNDKFCVDEKSWQNFITRNW